MGSRTLAWAGMADMGLVSRVVQKTEKNNRACRFEEIDLSFNAFCVVEGSRPNSEVCPGALRAARCEAPVSATKGLGLTAVTSLCISGVAW